MRGVGEKEKPSTGGKNKDKTRLPAKKEKGEVGLKRELSPPSRGWVQMAKANRGNMRTVERNKSNLWRTRRGTTPFKRGFG